MNGLNHANFGQMSAAGNVPVVQPPVLRLHSGVEGLAATVDRLEGLASRLVGAGPPQNSGSERNILVTVAGSVAASIHDDCDELSSLNDRMMRAIDRIEAAF